MPGSVAEEIYKLNVDTLESIKAMQALQGAYRVLTEEQRAQIAELKILEEKERQLQAARLKSTNPTTQIQLTNQIKEQRKQIDELTKSVALFTAESQEAVVETNALAQSINNAFKVTQVTAATNEVKKLNSVYDQTALKYNSLIKAQMELSIRGRENGVVFRSIKSEAEGLRSQLDRAEGGIRAFSVDGVRSFGTLQNSVNQLSRELPAFAVNANTGFLAISNNLPIFFDALSRTTAETKALTEAGKAAPSVLSQVGKAIFSVGSLLSIGVTLLTIYGGDLVKLISSVFQAEKAFQLEEAAMKTLNDEMERQIKLQDELQTALDNTNKEIAKLKIGDIEDQLLDNIDKALDKYSEIEKGRVKAAAKAVADQLTAGDKEAEIETRNANGIIEIINKKNGTIIRLDAEGKQVLGRYSAFYNQLIFTREEKALNDRLALINKENQLAIDRLDKGLTAQNELVAKKEEEKDKVRERYSAREIVRQRDALDQIRQLQIENVKDEEQREIEQQLFDTEKAIREIDRANQVEKEKLATAKANYAEKRRIEIANEKDQKQLNFNLIKLNQDYNKEVARIKADNIPKEQQIELRLRLEEELFRKLEAIRVKFEKETIDAIKDGVKRTYDARIDIINENSSFELYLLDERLRKEKDKGDKANKDEIKRLRDLIKERKILILEERAEQDIADLKRDKRNETNAAEELAIKNKLAHDIQKVKDAADREEVEKDKKHRKKLIQQYVDYIAQLIHATIDATNKIIALKIKEVDTLIGQQEKRVEAARQIADRGNAELLELEQKRLDDLNKQREKYVRQQQALAAVELVANTAIAVSKAAAQGGVAAGVTIAAALIALIAGLATARSIASQAAYYDGGYTGNGNPREESITMGGRPAPRTYTYHKEEFVFNHKKTRQFREIFEDIHRGRIDLNDWKNKADMFDQMASYKGFTTTAPTHAPVSNVTIIQFNALERKTDILIDAVQALDFGLNIDENGFTGFMAKKKQWDDKKQRVRKL